MGASQSTNQLTPIGIFSLRQMASDTKETGFGSKNVWLNLYLPCDCSILIKILLNLIQQRVYNP